MSGELRSSRDSITHDDLGAARVACESPLPGVRLARFGAHSSEEIHLSIEADGDGGFREQLAQVEATYRAIAVEFGLAPSACLFRRVYLSDAANQLDALMASTLGFQDGGVTAVAAVEQTPLPYHKLALQAWFLRAVKEGDGERNPVAEAGPYAHAVHLRRPGYSQLWTAQWTAPPAPGAHACCRAQTRRLLELYRDHLATLGGRLRTDLLRTWWYVHNVDSNYLDMVAARRELFADEGLTATTHYVVSTGIAGRTSRADCLAMLDAFAIPGFDSARLRYLDAIDHLNRTSDYGVTFERAARLDHGDRRHILLSGTASIDACGAVVHPGDVRAQTERTVKNMAALLAAGGASLQDLASVTVYLRDAADAHAVRALLGQLFPALPYVVVHAPVCRPGWLVEIEGLAIIANSNSGLPGF